MAISSIQANNTNTLYNLNVYFSKKKTSYKVALAAIGVGALAFSLLRGSYFSLGFGAVSLGASYKFEALRDSLIYKEQTREEQLEEVKIWQSTARKNCSNQIALERILHFINTPEETEIDLSKLNITSLPNVFNSSRLKSLNLSGSLLEMLPEGFNPPGLETLDLSETELMFFPDNFNPPQLKHLILRYCINLQEFPEKFNPINLEVLDCTGSRIQNLPDSFTAPKLKKLIMPGCHLSRLPDQFSTRNLEELNLMFTSISSLPVGFNPPKLKVLKLSYSQIHFLPDGFNPPNLQTLLLSSTLLQNFPDGFNPKALKRLALARCPLSELRIDPEHPKLEYLNVSHSSITSLPQGFKPPLLNLLLLDLSSLTSLPDTLLELPSNCSVSLTINQFSQATQIRLRELTSAPTYNGPQIEFNIYDDRPPLAQSTILSAEEALNKIYKEAQLTRNGHADEFCLFEKLPLQNMDQVKHNFTTWTKKLFWTASAKSPRKESFFKSISKFILLAINDPSFRPIFHEVVRGAITSCGDRVALSTVHLDIQSKLKDRQNAKELYHFLVNTVYTMDNLEKCARKIIASLNLTDPIEVYLALPIKFKKEFQIDINVDEMLYYSCSELTDTHLQEARKDLKRALQDEGQVLAFLIDQPKWIGVLTKRYPDEIDRAKKERDHDASDLNLAAKAMSKYQKTLQTLSAQLIEEIKQQ